MVERFKYTYAWHASDDRDSSPQGNVAVSEAQLRIHSSVSGTSQTAAVTRLSPRHCKAARRVSSSSAMLRQYKHCRGLPSEHDAQQHGFAPDLVPCPARSRRRAAQPPRSAAKAVADAQADRAVNHACPKANSKLPSCSPADAATARPSARQSRPLAAARTAAKAEGGRPASSARRP